MFNINDELQNFKPIDIVNLEQKLGTIPEDMKGAIELYNKALEDISSRNEDMAIIALKKAVTIYPAFYEAMNLMGVCFNSLEDEENARRMFNKVIQMENSSIRAKEYLDKLDGVAGREEVKSKTQKNKNKNKNKSQTASWVIGGVPAEKASPQNIKYIIGFLAGVVLMGVLWLVYPAGKELINISPKVNDTQQFKALQEEYTDKTQRLNEALESLETANEKEMMLREEMEQYKKWNQSLRGLQDLADSGKYRDVVIEVEKNLVGLEIPEDIENEIIALNNECKPKAIQQIYESAKKMYEGNLKTRSAEVFNKAATEYMLAVEIMEQVENKPTNAAEIYYYGGKAVAHSETPTKEQALAEARGYFEKVRELIPNTQLAYYAQTRIKEIDSGKDVKD